MINTLLLNPPHHNYNYREKSVFHSIMVTLIIGKAGHIVNGLCSLLKAHPDLAVLAPVDNISDGLAVIHEKKPQLLIFDSTLRHEEVLDALKQIKSNYPDIFCIVIVEKSQHYHAALGAGADGALFTGFPVEHLLRTVNRLQIGNYHDIEK